MFSLLQRLEKCSFLDLGGSAAERKWWSVGVGCSWIFEEFTGATPTRLSRS